MTDLNMDMTETTEAMQNLICIRVGPVDEIMIDTKGQEAFTVEHSHGTCSYPMSEMESLVKSYFYEKKRVADCKVNNPALVSAFEGFEEIYNDVKEQGFILN